VSRLSDNFYLTVDLDVFDPSIVPAVGTPEPGGLSWDQVLALLRAVVSERNLVGFDVVELSPIPRNHSSDFIAASLVYKIIGYLFQSERGSPSHRLSR
jgi:agmatinase